MSNRQATFVTGGVLFAALGGAIALTHGPQLISFIPLADSGIQPHEMQALALREARRSQPNLVQSSASPLLVKAMAQRRPVRTAVRAKLVRRQGPMRSVHQPYAQGPEQWIVLTEWSVSEAPTHVMYAVEQSNRPSYAALATPMGWLIVQI